LYNFYSAVPPAAGRFGESVAPFWFKVFFLSVRTRELIALAQSAVGKQ
jgi:hypothetical protein